MLLNRLVAYTAIAAALSLLERAIPLIPPWCKPGLANIITLYLAARGEYGLAFLVAALRGFAAALAFGGLFSPAHVFSLAGGGAAVLLTIVLCRFAYRYLSLYGVSVAAALAHALAQLACAGLLFLSWDAAMLLLPVMLAFSVLTGFLTAYLARRILIREAPV
jgi:heptaprenyl diphosphate synthase